MQNRFWVITLAILALTLIPFFGTHADKLESVSSEMVPADLAELKAVEDQFYEKVNGGDSQEFLGDPACNYNGCCDDNEDFYAHNCPDCDNCVGPPDGVCDFDESDSCSDCKDSCGIGGGPGGGLCALFPVSCEDASSGNTLECPPVCRKANGGCGSCSPVIDGSGCLCT